MATFEVPIREIEIEDHPNADRLEIANIVGMQYQSLVPIGKYETGDLVAYIPEDSLVPEWIQERLGVKGKLAGSDKNRVKAVRLRGVYSQGLCFPVKWIELGGNELPCLELEYGSKFILFSNREDYPNVEEVKEEIIGKDVQKTLGIEKYEPPIPVHMSGEVFNARGNTLRYDVENYKKYPDVIEEDEEVAITEKVHGCADYDVLVETLEYGVVKIGEIVENKIHCSVKSLNTQTGEVEYKPIEGYSIMENNDDWYEIELENGTSVKLTGNHPVWLPNLNCYRRVDELNGDEEVEFDF